MHLCGKDYKRFSLRCCKCNSFGCIAATRCCKACHRPHSDSLYSGSEHHQFNLPGLVKREAGFPNLRRALTQTSYDALMTHHTTENYEEMVWCRINGSWKMALISLYSLQSQRDKTASGQDDWIFNILTRQIMDKVVTVLQEVRILLFSMWCLGEFTQVLIGPQCWGEDFGECHRQGVDHTFLACAVQHTMHCEL